MTSCNVFPVPPLSQKRKVARASSFECGTGYSARTTRHRKTAALLGRNRPISVSGPSAAYLGISYGGDQKGRRDATVGFLIDPGSTPRVYQYQISTCVRAKRR